MSVFVRTDLFLSKDEMEKLQDELQQHSDEQIVLLPNYCRLATPGVLYECDRRACKTCHSECHMTHSIEHAVNFKRNEFGSFVEQR
jgi:hypothetical protein